MERVSGKKLRAWRHARGLTQQQAADLAEIDQASWHQYEHGRIPRDVAVIGRLVKLTRRTPHALELDDFAETEAEKERRKARMNVAKRDESGPTLPEIESTKAG
jgi:transcriptional regulator with XRE-family HTH domain